MIQAAGLGAKGVAGAGDYSRTANRGNKQTQVPTLSGRQGHIEIRTTPGKLEIDSTVPRAEMGYYTMQGLLKEIVKLTTKKRERGIADIVTAGDRLARYDKEGNTIAALSREKAFRDLQEKKFVFNMIPRTPPAIRYTPGTLSIDFVI
jgi:hypothetical protein